VRDSAAWLAGPHRRFNPLLREWVLVSPHRTARPWLGESGPVDRTQRPAYDPDCYLCPGNLRAGGERNPAYASTYVFENDFAALLPGIPGEASLPGDASDAAGLMVAQAEHGRARVVCFSPRHDLSLARMAPSDVRGVVDAWSAEYVRLGAESAIRSVTIFENRGEAMGASNPHPHAQIWANEHVPNLPAREGAALADYAAAHGACLLCAYVERELALGERVVFAGPQVTVLVPFWAVWPFETLLIPRRHAASLELLASNERDALAAAIQRLTGTYDRVFDVPFPYSMGFHQRPTDGEAHAEWHAHAHYFPPLLRSASVRKYMVGYELLAMPQRDITPESAAERLRTLAASHEAG
jgi:UDPglucose--hexose-1-phosphate uridylyltransferase